MDLQENKEKFYIEVTSYVNKEVSRDEYHNHLRFKLNARYDMLMDLKLKQQKIDAEVKAMEDKVKSTFDDIAKISSKQDAIKDVEYSEWRFEVMNKRKASKLPLKEITSKLLSRLQ